jgi:peptidoglycan/xylan/chitin deacetylase (PgdA/CDA1 family)
VKKSIFISLFFLVLAFSSPPGETGVSIPILAYHRLGPVVADSMTIPTEVFESHLKWIQENGYKVLPLRELIHRYFKAGFSPPAHSLVITVDDGHISAFTDLFPLVKKYRVPVTLFLYPSAISNASYAMKWDQLREMKESGLVDFHSHTYWHPNFKKEKKRLSPEEYEKFVNFQLQKSKAKLEHELGIQVDLLAWPFGIYDPWLMAKAKQAAYTAAFSIERRQASAADPLMALPRYLLTPVDRGPAFARVINGFSRKDP